MSFPPLFHYSTTMLVCLDVRGLPLPLRTPMNKLILKQNLFILNLFTLVCLHVIWFFCLILRAFHPFWTSSGTLIFRSNFQYIVWYGWWSTQRQRKAHILWRLVPFRGQDVLSCPCRGGVGVHCRPNCIIPTVLITIHNKINSESAEWKCLSRQYLFDGLLFKMLYTRVRMRREIQVLLMS